jgi:hypothetical protein
LSVNPTSVIGVEFDLGERLYENQSKQTAIWVQVHRSAVYLI